MSKRTINIHEAKTHLSRLVDEVHSGAEVVIARAGKPVVRITQLAVSKRMVRFGLLKGKVRVGADFDAALPDDILAAFEGR